MGCSGRPPVSRGQEHGRQDIRETEIHDLVLYFDDLHLFHRVGSRLWMDQGGRLLLFGLVRSGQGGITQVKGQLRLSKQELLKVIERIQQTSGLECDMESRPGIPDEVPVTVHYRAADGTFHSFSTWYREWRSPMCPRGDALRRLVEELIHRLDGHSAAIVLSEDAPVEEPTWPGFIRKPEL